MNGTWIDDGQELRLKLPSGDVHMVSAMDIYRAVFQNASAVQGVAVRSPTVDLPHLNFSRYPAEPAVRTTTGDGCIRIDVGVKAGGEFVFLPDAGDQVIHGGEWYPVQREAVEALQAWLDRVEGAQQGTGSLATLIALRTRRDMPGELLDTINQDSAGLAASVPVAEKSVSGLVADLYPY